MILNWPVAIIVIIILLPIGVVATFYPIVGMRFFMFWFHKFFQIPPEELSLKEQKFQQEFLYLLNNDPEEYTKRFGSYLLIMQTIGCFALLAGVTLLAIITLNVTSLVRN